MNVLNTFWKIPLVLPYYVKNMYGYYTNELYQVYFAIMAKKLGRTLPSNKIEHFGINFEEIFRIVFNSYTALSTFRAYF